MSLQLTTNQSTSMFNLKKYTTIIPIVLIAQFQCANAGTNLKNSENKAPFYLALETGYSKSMNMKGSYDLPMHNAMLIGLGLKYGIGEKCKIGLNISQRSGYRYDHYVEILSAAARSMQDIKIFSVLSTISYDIASFQDNKVIPFVELGIGVSQVDAGTYTRTVDVIPAVSVPGQARYNLTYSAMLGLDFKITDSVRATLGLRNINFGKVTTVVTDSPTSISKETGKAKANEVSFSLMVKL